MNRTNQNSIVPPNEINFDSFRLFRNPSTTRQGSDRKCNSAGRLSAFSPCQKHSAVGSVIPTVNLLNNSGATGDVNGN